MTMSHYVKFPNFRFWHRECTTVFKSFICYNYFNGAFAGPFAACSDNNKGYNNFKIVTISQTFIFKWCFCSHCCDIGASASLCSTCCGVTLAAALTIDCPSCKASTCHKSAMLEAMCLDAKCSPTRTHCYIIRTVRPRPHVSGDFCVSKFFYADTKISAPTRIVIESYTTVHTYPICIRTSQRISQQILCGKRLVLILWRQCIQKYTDTSVHMYPDTQRIQKFPLWRAYTEISGYIERIRRTRVDARCICIKKFADAKSSRYVWTVPEIQNHVACEQACLNGESAKNGILQTSQPAFAMVLTK